MLGLGQWVEQCSLSMLGFQYCVYIYIYISIVSLSHLCSPISGLHSLLVNWWLLGLVHMLSPQWFLAALLRALRDIGKAMANFFFHVSLSGSPSICRMY